MGRLEAKPVMLNAPPTLWECPNCGKCDITHEKAPHTRFHRCRALAGLDAPMVKVDRFEGKKKAKVEAVVREDYVNGEKVQYDEKGRPIMSIVTTREDGNDVVVFAAPAQIRS